MHSAPGTPAGAMEAAAAFLRDFTGTVTDPSSGDKVDVVSFAWGYCDEVVIDPGDPSVMYVPTIRGVYKSNDQGKTWNRATAGDDGFGRLRRASRPVIALYDLCHHLCFHRQVDRRRSVVDHHP